MTLFERMKHLSMKYCGEITQYSRYIKNETIDGIYGTWYIHEFGGECFVPYSHNGYVNRSAFCKEG